MLNYTTLSVREIAIALDEVARDSDATFGGLDAGQLNWQPDPRQWSIARCLEPRPSCGSSLTASSTVGASSLRMTTGMCSRPDAC
jgi:hypothetical protein